MFSEHTMVLSAEGTYKNIDDISIGSLVITGQGTIATVTSITSGNFSEMVEVRNDNWFAPFYGTNQLEVLTDNGWTKTQDLLLTQKFKNGSELNQSKLEFKFPDYIPTYELGNLIGLYIGYGNISNDIINFKFANNTELVSEIRTLFKELFDVELTSTENAGNIDLIVSDAKVVDFFRPFGTKINRIIPTKYLSTDSDYVKGIFDGLSEYNESSNDNICITVSNNTAELFVWLSNKQGYAVTNDTATLIAGVTSLLTIYKLCAGREHLNPEYVDMLEYNVETVARKGVYIHTNLPEEGIIVNNLVVRNY